MSLPADQRPADSRRGLSVHDLTCVRGGRPVIAHLSFEVAPGAVLVLRGANGVGKTTVLRTLAGLQPPLSGRIDVDADSCAYASHADGVKSTLTVSENLAFWASVYGYDLDPAVFAAFDLTDLSDRLAGALSAGQRRRVGLARLAVIRRAVLFLDEPTVSLDALSVRRFGAWLREEHLSRGGLAVIATHVDLGFEAPILDLEQFRAGPDARGGSDEAFL
jgi:heme exporter protein A